MAALLGACVWDGPWNPANITAPRSPLMGRILAATSRVTLSVRSSDAPEGSCTTARK